MTTSEIQSFLAICRYKTVTRAAENLYITQSSLSTRLRTLERELGSTLFSRRKGSREMILTSMGKQFFDLAVQYDQIISQMEQLCRKNSISLRVSSLNSLGTYVLPAVYEAFLQEHPDIELEIQDKELGPACKSIACGLTDLSFATGLGSEPGTKGFLAFSEPMVLICSKNSSYPSTIDLKNLPIRNEIFVPWCASFDRWHHLQFGIGAQPQVSISIMEQLKLFIKRENSWAIVPSSVAAGLERVADISRCDTTEPLPTREVYCIVSENSDNPAIPYFISCLRKVLETLPEIKSAL